MPTNRNLSDLIINKVESQEVFEQMQTNNLLNDDELYLIQDEGAEGDDTLYLESVPGETTEGRKGQRAVVLKYGNATTDYAYYYICYGYVTDGGTRKYIWSQVNSKTITHAGVEEGKPIIFTKSGTFYAADYGLSVGDTVTVAVVSGGNGGMGCGFDDSIGGDAGKGGPAGPNVVNFSVGGGGGGAGRGYGAGGGGAGGYTKLYDVSGSMSYGGDGGRAGGCNVSLVTLTSTTIPVTVGIGGKGYNGSGSDTTHIGGSSSFGSYVSVAGGTGQQGGDGGSTVSNPALDYDPERVFDYACGGGGGGGGGWYYVSGTGLSQYGSGSNGTDGVAQSMAAGYDGYGGDGGSGGGGVSGGAGGHVNYSGWSGESTESTAGSDGDLGGNGVVYIWI